MSSMIVMNITPKSSANKDPVEVEALTTRAKPFKQVELCVRFLLLVKSEPIRKTWK